MKIDLEILKMETDTKIKIMQEETKKNSNQADFLLRSQESQRQDIELSKNLNEKTSVRDLNIGIANLNNGSFVSFNNNFKTKDLIKVLKASVSFPSIF